MNLLIQTPVNKRISFLRVENDKPFVSGFLFAMKSPYKPTPSTAPCNKCGQHPKYPDQGLCRKCYFEKIHKKWVDSRPQKLMIPNLPKEKWANVKEFTGYDISNMGRVKSLNYMGEEGRHHIIKLAETRKGSYLRADFIKASGGRRLVHRLVAEYFVANPKNYPIVLHKDEDKQNNVYSNLEWGTKSKNGKDYFTYATKEGIQRKKLSEKGVIEILNSKETVQSLSIKYNISASIIWGIKNGKRWNSVTGLPKTRKPGRNN